MQFFQKQLMMIVLYCFMLFYGCTSTIPKTQVSNTEDRDIAKGREYWYQAEFNKAAEIARFNKDTDAGKHLRGDLYAIKGSYQDAVDTYQQISSDYPGYRKVLKETMNIHAVHFKNIPKAKLLAAQLKTIAAELEDAEQAGIVYINALSQPMKVVTKGTFVVPMDISHPYNPYMPVITGSVNGRKESVLFDSGGNYLVITEKKARELGIEFDENLFFIGKQGHSESKMWVGVAQNLKLGDELELEHVPVTILDKINTNQELIIFGTTILKEFVTTIDGPNNQFIFTTRESKELVDRHLKKFQGNKMAFVMYGDHFMMGKGKYNGKDINMFWDSGLVVVGVVDGKPAQAWLNVNEEARGTLGIEEELNPTQVTTTTDSLEFAGIVNKNALICGKPGKAYEWGGIRADILVGYGIQKRFAWTIDFDNMTYMFK